MKVLPPQLHLETHSDHAQPGHPLFIQVRVTERWAENLYGQDVALSADGIELQQTSNPGGKVTFVFNAPDVSSDALEVRLRPVPGQGDEFSSEAEEVVVRVPVRRQ